jgi:hypothetical protein
LVIAMIIGALAFTTIAGSIALLVRNAAAMKTELYEDIDRRNTLAAELKTDFSKE